MMARLRLPGFARWIGVAALTFAGAAMAAQPRMSRTLTSNSVRLSDLFAGLEPGQDCEIGPAPPPGKRLVIEEAQLEAIATQFSIAWQPGPVRTEVVLEHAARFVHPAEYLALVRTALITSGAPADIDINLVGDTVLNLPVENTSPAEIDAVTFDPQNGAFAVSLRFFSTTGDPVVFQISGTALEMIDLPVLKRSMQAGSVIASGDLQSRRLRRNLVGSRTLLAAGDAVGLALHSQVAAGVPLSLDDLRLPVLVVRGMAVTLHFESAGLILTAKGEAIEAGSMDDRIHILNPGSRSVLVGRVTGLGTVQLDPVAPPIFLGQQSGLPQPYSFAGTNTAFGQRWSGQSGSGP